MLKHIAATAALGAVLALAACDSRGSAEKAGENVDSAIEETTQGHKDLGDGPMEKTGEAIDHATGARPDRDPADAAHDSTDGDPRTKPN